MKPHSILFQDDLASEYIASEFLSLFEHDLNTDMSKIEVIYTHFTPIDYDCFENLKYVVCPCTNVNHLKECGSPEGVKFIYLDDTRKLFNKVNSSPEWVINQIFNLIKHNKEKSDELVGKTIGFIGYGRMMQRVAQLLSGYVNYGNVCMSYWDLKEPEFFIHSSVIRCSNMESLIESSDIIVVGLSENEKTEGLIDGRAFNCIQEKGSYFINNSRSSIVDEYDLIEAIERNILKGVALDVIENYTESSKKTLYLWANGPRNVHVTPHIAGKGVQSREATDRIVLEALKKELAKDE